MLINLRFRAWLPRKLHWLSGFFLLFLFVAPLSAQMVYLSGRVLERGTNEEIAGASLALMGTTRGAKANRDGVYRLALISGTSYRIRVTAIGYKPDTITITLTHDETRDVVLATSPIPGSTITVAADASRNEAHRIIQKVIDTKDTWQSKINSYKFDVYSRLNVSTRIDTTTNILGILETVAEGFWKRDRGYAERITARKQTANLPASANKVAVFDLENFYNERLEVGDYDVVGPVAHDAFDRYDYDLVGQAVLNGAPVYKISVTPSSNLYPAFQGTLWIDQNDYTIIYLDLAPDAAIKIGPVKDIHLVQTFNLVDNLYWMPSQLSFSAAIKFDIPLIPEFDIAQSAVLQNYEINPTLPDSLFVKDRHVVAATADSVDSLSWNQLRTIPLALDETHAYTSFDSISKLPPVPHKVSPLGLLIDLVTLPDLYQFNRVEGSRFQLGGGIDKIGNWPLSANGFIAYGLGDKRWKYSASLRQGLTWSEHNQASASLSSGGGVSFDGIESVLSVSSSVGLTVQDNYERAGVAYDPLINTATTLLFHNDYPDYYRARGATIDYSASPFGANTFQIYGSVLTESSLRKITNYNLLEKGDTLRNNSPINDGTIREAGLSMNIPFESGHWSFEPSARVGIGNQSFVDTHPLFSYLTLGLSIDGKAGGWGKSHIAANFSSLLHGAFGAQQLFYFEARDAIFAPFDVFHTMYPLEFQGDRTWSLMLEQNMYDLPPRLFGIDLPGNIQWIAFANLAGATLSTATATLTGPIKTIGTTPFIEAGAGLGNILNIIRVDAAWRITHRTTNNFFVTGTLAISF